MLKLVQCNVVFSCGRRTSPMVEGQGGPYDRADEGEEEEDDKIFGTVTQNGNIYLQRYQEGSLYRLLSLSVTDYHLFPFMYKFDITGMFCLSFIACMSLQMLLLIALLLIYATCYLFFAIMLKKPSIFCR